MFSSIWSDHFLLLACRFGALLSIQTFHICDITHTTGKSTKSHTRKQGDDVWIFATALPLISIGLHATLLRHLDASQHTDLGVPHLSATPHFIFLFKTMNFHHLMRNDGSFPCQVFLLPFHLLNSSHLNPNSLSAKYLQTKQNEKDMASESRRRSFFFSFFQVTTNENRALFCVFCFAYSVQNCGKKKLDRRCS